MKYEMKLRSADLRKSLLQNDFACKNWLRHSQGGALQYLANILKEKIGNIYQKSGRTNMHFPLEKCCVPGGGLVPQDAAGGEAVAYAA